VVAAFTELAGTHLSSLQETMLVLDYITVFPMTQIWLDIKGVFEDIGIREIIWSNHFNFGYGVRVGLISET
jgi:hypothetical protein